MDFEKIATDIVKESGYDLKKAAKKSAAGRKNTGKTAAHYEEYKINKLKKNRALQSVKQSNDFEIIEKCSASLVESDDPEQFRELYSLTCKSILEDFKRDNSELVKKHPYNWFKSVLLQIKKAVPKITADDLDKVNVVWDCLCDLMYNIGLYPTYEIFYLMTGISKEMLKRRSGVNSKYLETIKKISNEADSALITELAMSPYNSTNKIFLAKVHGIIEKTEPKQVEVVHRLQGLDDIPIFGIEQKSDN